MSSLSQNRQAYHDFEVVEKFVAGIALQGTEVKSCRAGDISLAEAYAAVEDGDLWLQNCHIAPYAQGNRQNHEPKRPRRLLMHKAEIRKLKQATEAKGMTVVPLAFFLQKGKIKVELGLCRGKNVADKRETLKRKTAEREIRREIRGR